jgi:Zn-dependent peptidase ImmA (M78 family)
MVIEAPPSVEKERVREEVVYGRKEMEAERDAQQLLQKAWLKDGRSDLRLPVDPFAIARELGVQVYIDRSLPPEVSGMLRKQAGYSDPEILLNAADSRNRQRFTCAHELGHYTQRVKNGKDGAWEYVDKRDPLSSQGMDVDEVYANQFAAELLMPRDVVAERSKTSNAAALAIDFGVSGDAMGFRLDNLHLA